MIEDRIEVNIAGGLDIPLPPMASVRQKFTTTRIDDIDAAVAREFERPEVRASVKRGARIAVGCGSRGVANYALIARAVIREIKALGGDPFVFPAMGSHGAATAEGQRVVLEGAGITEAFVGAPIRASMDTIEAGRMADGTPVYADALAAAAPLILPMPMVSILVMPLSIAPRNVVCGLMRLMSTMPSAAAARASA